MSHFKYATPNPSLCDTCKKAYIMEGGFVGTNDATYRQRYCNYPIPGQPNLGRSISVWGYTECGGYEKTN